MRRSRDWAGDAPAEAIFASPPPVAVLAPRPGLARGRLLPPQPLRSASAASARSADCQPTNMDDPLVREAIRRDPRAAQVPAMVDPAAGRGRAQPLHGTGRHRRRALRPAAGRSRLAREIVVPLGGPGCPRTSTTPVEFITARHEHARRASGAGGPRLRDRRRLLARLVAPGLRARPRQHRPAARTRRDRRDPARRLAAAARLPRARAGRSRSTSAAGWRWSGWRPRARSAGTRRGSWANGRRPDPVPLFELFSANAVALGDIGRAKGPCALDQRARPPAARQCAAARRAPTSPPTTTSATISTRPGSTRR